MTAEEQHLIIEAAAYIERRERRLLAEPFPVALTRLLLRSGGGDLQLAGLHLTSLAGPPRIRQFLFSDPGTFPSLAMYLAADAAWLIEGNKVEGMATLDRAEETVRRRWTTAPDELVERTKQLLADHPVLKNASSRPLTAPHRGGGPNRVALLIHGTWAANATWWRPNTGSLWLHVQKYWKHLYHGPNPFAWSGANRHSARLQAAQQLVAWVQADGASSVDVVAHSHGGNVCLLASRLGLKFDRLILLGTPIRTEYLPEMQKISQLHNVFSVKDCVQTPFGTFRRRRAEGRTLGDSTVISNWRAVDNGSGSDPDHSELHEPGTWNASRLNVLGP
jgi:hypothetical protein